MSDTSGQRWSWGQSDREFVKKDWDAIIESLPLIKKVLDFKSSRYTDIKKDYNEYYSFLLRRMVEGMRTFDHSKKTRFGAYILPGLHQAIKELRKKRKRKEGIETRKYEGFFYDIKDKRQDSNPDTNVMRKEIIMIVRQTICSLPEKYRNILCKRIYQEKIYEEIAKETNVCRETIRNIFFKALSMIKERMERRGLAEDIRELI